MRKLIKILCTSFLQTNYETKIQYSQTISYLKKPFLYQLKNSVESAILRMDELQCCHLRLQLSKFLLFYYKTQYSYQ